MRRRLAPALVLAALLASVSSSARAEAPNGGIALEQLRPSPAGDTFVAVPSPFVAGHLVPRALVLFDFASRPLVLARGAEQLAVVGQQAFLQLGASMAFWDRLLVAVNLPLALIQGGDSPAVASAQKLTFSSPSSTQVGDLRLDARVRLFGENGGPFQIGTGASLHFPTAPKDSFAGEGAVRLEPHLLLGGQHRGFVWSAAGGALFRASDNPALVTFGAGVGYGLFPDRLQLGVEVFGAVPLQDRSLVLGKVPVGSWGTASNAELLVDTRLRVVGGLYLGLAGGPGLSKAIGTPAFRVLGSIAWSPRVASTAGRPVDLDADADGLPDGTDACPYAFGERTNKGCPLLDGDDDGVPDGVDACAKESGVKSADPKRNGCPPDRDGDGTTDLLDLCPDQVGNNVNNGCPAATPPK